MILVDTSVWIEHLARGSKRLAEVLGEGRVITHPFVEGELACGHLRNRLELLGLLQTLPQAPQVPHEEALELLQRERLYGSGLSWIDVHLLASARALACSLWSLDGSLSRSAVQLGIEAV